jgi:hypothetical protein
VSPFLFTPTPLPKAPGDWLLVLWLVAVWFVLERFGKARSAILWVVCGFLVGMFYGGGNVGGFAGSLVGIVLGLGYARIGRDPQV